MRRPARPVGRRSPTGSPSTAREQTAPTSRESRSAAAPLQASPEAAAGGRSAVPEAAAGSAKHLQGAGAQRCPGLSPPAWRATDRSVAGCGVPGAPRSAAQPCIEPARHPHTPAGPGAAAGPCPPARRRRLRVPALS